GGTDPVQNRTQVGRPEETYSVPIVTGNFFMDLNIGNVIIGEVRGDARVTTRAGEIQLDKVWGSCTVISLGGPLNLGDIIGSVNATTHAGDVLVRAARDGGRLATGGGSLRLLYNGGAASLRSEGGDIVVR